MGCVQARRAREERLRVTWRLGWYAQQRWVRSKEEQADFVASVLLDPVRNFDVIQKLYHSLGGHADADSPVYLKGGVAASLYLRQQVLLFENELPAALRVRDAISDVDFGCNCGESKLMEKMIPSLIWLTELAKECRLQDLFQVRWPEWQIRDDRNIGESFGTGKRQSSGATECKQSVKVTHHIHCLDRYTRKAYNLMRVGLGVWSNRHRRASMANFVDISLAAGLPTVDVMSMRLQSASSMLRSLRCMSFHQVNYQPWRATADEDKLERRFRRLIHLSFVEDYKHMGGRYRGQEATHSLLRRWREVPELLLMADANAIYAKAESVPAQLRFFLKVCARTCNEAGVDDMPDYDYWLGKVVFPLVDKLMV